MKTTILIVAALSCTAQFAADEVSANAVTQAKAATIRIVVFIWILLRFS